jgi:hypothetical protein
MKRKKVSPLKVGTILFLVVVLVIASYLVTTKKINTRSRADSNVIFSDNFEKGNLGWRPRKLGLSGRKYLSFVGGEMVLYSARVDGMTYTFAPMAVSQMPSHYSVEADLRRVRGGGGVVKGGLFFELQEKENIYYALIFSFDKNLWTLYLRGLPGGDKIFGRGTVEKADSYHLKLERDIATGRLQAFCNGVLLVEANSDYNVRGQLGVVVYSEITEGSFVGVDNFVVKSL